MVLDDPCNLIISDCEVSDTFMVPACPGMSGDPCSVTLPAVMVLDAPFNIILLLLVSNTLMVPDEPDDPNAPNAPTVMVLNEPSNVILFVFVELPFVT